MTRIRVNIGKICDKIKTQLSSMENADMTSKATQTWLKKKLPRLCELADVTSIQLAAEFDREIMKKRMIQQRMFNCMPAFHAVTPTDEQIIPDWFPRH